MNEQKHEISPFETTLYLTGTDAEETETPWLSAPLLLFFGLLIFVVWAAVFEIDQSVRATGQIIPVGRTQIIQTADGGVLAEILVREGEWVSAGQSLAVLEQERINATFEESRSKVAALSVALVRAKAEVGDQSPDFGEDFGDFPVFVDAQRNLYQQRKQSLHDELATLNESLDMAKTMLGMQENLLASGSTSELEVMNAQQKVNDIQGEIINVRNKYLSEAYQEMTKLEADIDVARHKQSERKSMLEHTEIKAPATGVVKYLKFNTLGGVLRPGDELMQISPTENDLIIEVKINPIDIGLLVLGMPVSIKLDAFDYSIYGSLEGTLSYISSDTLVESANDETLTFYRAQVTLDKNSKDGHSKLASVELKPGMTTSIDIQTNKRTILAYLSKPVTRAFSGALNER